MRLPRVLILLAVAFIYPTAAALSAAHDIPADTPVASLLSSAQEYLSQGDSDTALLYYDAAVARDPSDSLALLKRATVHLALGHTSSATDDLNKVLSLSPGLEGAHAQLARIKARVADWDGAREHYALARKGPESAELTELARAQEDARLAGAAEKRGDWQTCVDHAASAIKFASRAASLRETRARCWLELGEVASASIDLQNVLQLKPGDLLPHVKISVINCYSLGDLDAAISQARKCLVSDPDSKPCRALLKRHKAIKKATEAAERAVRNDKPATAARILTGSAEEPGLIDQVKEEAARFSAEGTLPANAPKGLYAKLIHMACQSQFQAKGKKAGAICAESLALDPSSLYGLLHKAQQHMDGEMFDAALETYRKASEAHRDQDHTLIQPLVQEAQVALRRSKNKDYYKVLSVPRDADSRQIKSAYRKLSKQFHPDKAAAHGISKEEAERKMAQLNEAYEVLSDSDLRARFDMGDDPNSPGGGSGGGGGGHSPFHGAPFGGGMPFNMHQPGGGQFKFKFGGAGGPPFQGFQGFTFR